jgi:hypothetical protein
VPPTDDTNATTVRVQDGKTSTSEGPFLGDGGAVGGYFVFGADDLDAKRSGLAPGPTHQETGLRCMCSRG